MENQRGETHKILKTTTLFAIQDGIESLNTLLKATVAEGVLVPLGNIQVSSTILEISRSNPKYADKLPWKAITFYNDGPSAYYAAINANYIENPTPINQGEPFNADMGRDRIVKILLQAATPGAVANLRGYAVK